jgi:hypothetical protein
MSNYQHTRFGLKIETSGSKRFLQGLTIRSMLVLLVGMTVAGLVITSDLDLLLKIPLAAVPLSVTLVFLLVRPNDRPFEESLMNWVNFRRNPQASVFKGHHGDDLSGVQVDPRLNQSETALQVVQAPSTQAPPAEAQPLAVPGVNLWARVSLAGVLIGFWLVAVTSLLLVTTIRSRMLL